VTKVERGRANRWVCRRSGGGDAEDWRRGRRRQGSVDRRGLPHRARRGRNRVVGCVPVPARIARTRRAFENAGLGAGHHEDVIRRSSVRANGGRPQERGHANRDKDQTTHSSIVAARPDPGQTRRIPSSNAAISRWPLLCAHAAGVAQGSASGSIGSAPRSSSSFTISSLPHRHAQPSAVL